MNSLEVSRIAGFCTDYCKKFLGEDPQTPPHVNTTLPGYGLDRINRMQNTTCALSTVLHTKETLLCIYCLILRLCDLFFSSPEPKARVSYCHSAPSVRPSVVRKLFTFSTSSPEPLDGFWWNLVGMKYSWSLTSVVVFRPDPPRGGSRAGPK